MEHSKNAYNLQYEFYIMGVGLDVVLDIRWCILVGNYFSNHCEEFLSFHQHDHDVNLKGPEPKSIKDVDSKHMSKLCIKSIIWIYINIGKSKPNISKIVL